jgi:hypothetical protein
MKTNEEQLIPLKRRLNAHQQEKRVQKITARRTVAEAIIRDQRLFRLVMSNFFTRGFGGRLKWLVTGR